MCDPEEGEEAINSLAVPARAPNPSLINQKSRSFMGKNELE